MISIPSDKSQRGSVMPTLVVACGLAVILASILLLSVSRSEGALIQQSINSAPKVFKPSGEINIPPKMEIPINSTYRVFVRRTGGEWQGVPVYNVKVGHQEGDEPLRLSVDSRTYKVPSDASLALFDFNRTIEVKIVIPNGDASKLTVGPISYGLKPRIVSKDAIEFELAQCDGSPRKLIIRPVDNWDSQCLHVLTNPLELEVPDKSARNVLVIKPGDAIPSTLPAGKNTYYFMPGIHELPRGIWVDLDLGEPKKISSFDVVTGSISKYVLPGGIQFRIESRMADTDPWTLVHEIKGDPNAFDLKNVKINSVEARFFRLRLLGNYNPERKSGYNYPNSACVKQFILYDETGVNVSKGRAVTGSHPNYLAVTDGEGRSSYGFTWGAETFYIPHSDTNVYLAPGSVVRGSFGGHGLSGIRIFGRGILDASGLLHDHSLAEGRTSPIRFIDCSEISVEGLTILDAPMWGLVVNKSKKVKVFGVNIINSVCNGDGIHFSGSSDAEAKGCFIRICDDLFVLYHNDSDADELAFRNSVLWSDGGRIALFGMGGGGDIRNVKVENCDVLAHQSVWDAKVHGNIFMVWPTNGRLIKGVTFKDIRVEKVRYPEISGLFQLKTVLFGNRPPGFLSDVLFENIDYPFPGRHPSYLLGSDEKHSISNVVLRNIRWGDSNLNAMDSDKTIIFNKVEKPKFE